MPVAISANSYASDASVKNQGSRISRAISSPSIVFGGALQFVAGQPFLTALLPRRILSNVGGCTIPAAAFQKDEIQT